LEGTFTPAINFSTGSLEKIQSARMLHCEPSFSEFFVQSHGLPHPLWSRVHAHERAEVEPKDAEDFWRRFVWDWLSRVARALGAGYAVRESANFFLLSDAGEHGDQALLFRMERMRKEMFAVYGERLLPRGTVGKHVVLMFSDGADYARYYSRYLQDGETAASGGVCIRTGYVQIAIPRWPDSSGVLAHEFSHNLTSFLSLPCWLDEGLAMYMEQTIGGGTHAHADKFLESRPHWTPETIQQFWDGSAFFSTESQEAAYALSAMMFRTILTDVKPTPEALRKFVLAADFSDAGAYAYNRYIGSPLEALAAILLGKADWEPRPELWHGKPVPELPADEPAELDGELDENGYLWPKGMKPDPEPPKPPPPPPPKGPRHLDY
jgi:hypothetical protein